MPGRSTKPTDANVNREIGAYSQRAYGLAKAVVDGTAGDKEKQTAADLANELPEQAAKAKGLAEAYRADAQRSLSEARLDLAYVAAGGGIPSSIRLGRYIAEQESAAAE